MHVIKNRRRPAVAGAGIATAVLMAGLLFATPAHASAAQLVISGSGVVTDDFGDEATLSRNSQFRHSNAVGLWQWLLNAEGLLPQSGVDCDFGPNTEAATKSFQRRYHLDDDGIVGPLTWGRADNNLRNFGTIEDPAYESIDYVASSTGVSNVLHRSTANGYYSFPLANTWPTAWDNSASPLC